VGGCTNTQKEADVETYSLRTLNGTNDFITLLRETDEGFVIRIVRDKDGYNEIINEFMSKELFETCVRTGYLTKVEAKPLVATA
jgi:hypothetical protein